MYSKGGKAMHPAAFNAAARWRAGRNPRGPRPSEDRGTYDFLLGLGALRTAEGDVVVEREGAHPGRSDARVKLFRPAELIVGDTIARAHLLDVSPRGALVHTSEPPQIGMTVKLQFAGLHRRSRVIWVDGCRFGVTFDRPITAEQLAHLAATHDTAVRLRSPHGQRRPQPMQSPR